MIGNDIIDISLAKIQSNWKRPGFLEKQFTVDEIDSIQKSENPLLMVWRFWSMKESAYKVVVQQRHRRFFAPKKFECQIISESEGFVRFENQTFPSTTTTTSKYIYTVIGTANFQWIGNKMNRSEMLKLIERQTGTSGLELKIEKNAFGVPQLYQGSDQISHALSRTHHGRFEAFEYTLN